MSKEFKFHIIQKPGAYIWDIYLTEMNSGTLYIYNVDRNGYLKCREIDQEKGEVGKPMFSIPGHLWGDFVKVVSQDLPNVKRDEIDAELKATKYHLEDMRTLIFKKPKK